MTLVTRFASFGKNNLHFKASHHDNTLELLMLSYWKTLSFKARLTTLILTLVIGSIALVSSLIFINYKTSTTTAITQSLNAAAENASIAFTSWLMARQDEVKFAANLEPIKTFNAEKSLQVLANLALAHGFYDSIYVVGKDGLGMVGVAFADGKVTELNQTEAAKFKVDDREWFKRAIQGEEVFSKPLLSRSTGNFISNVVIPIKEQGRTVAVLRAAILLNNITNQVKSLKIAGNPDAFIIDKDAQLITPSKTQANGELKTQAGRGIKAKQSSTQQYTNANGETVIGSFHYLSMLDWGLVIEQSEKQALAEVQSMLNTIIVVSILISLISIAVSFVLTGNIVKILGGDPSYASQVVKTVASGNLTETAEIDPA